jgi:uncharacterized membrane protein
MPGRSEDLRVGQHQPGAGDPGALSATALLGHAAVLGAATGLRSTVALAALIARRSDGLPAAFGHPAARTAAVVADAGELVADKLPTTPSRLSPRGLGGRVIFASLAAVVLARSRHQSPVPAVLVAAASALGAAKIGHDTRSALGLRFPDLAVALVEDGLAIGLAVLGSSPLLPRQAQDPPGNAA